MEILEYKAQLEQKLATVNAIIAEMGVTAPKKRGRKPGSKVAKADKPKGKRKMSAAGRARIAAAAKARWAKVKAAGKKRLG